MFSCRAAADSGEWGWQERQVIDDESVGLSWQSLQARPACAPVSIGKNLALWSLMEMSASPPVGWQVRQAFDSYTKPVMKVCRMAATSGAWGWQEMQVNVSFVVGSWWQSAQPSVLCLPVSIGKNLALWS